MNYSVVIATYNGERYIRQQIESIISQSIKVDEIIICDDNSGDKTVEEVEKTLRSSDVIYKIIRHTSNKGVVETFEDAIRQSKGTYILFCDQDDVWVEDKIKKIDECIKMYKCKFIFSNADIVDANLKSKHKTMWEEIGFSMVPTGEHKMINKGQLIPLLLKRNVVTGMTVAIEKEFLLSVLPFPKEILHDSWMAFVSNLDYDVVAVNEPLVLYRQHDNNVIGTMKGSFCDRFKRAYFDYRNNVRKQYLKAELFRNWNVSHNNIEKDLINDYYEFMKIRNDIVNCRGSKIKFWKCAILGKYKTFFDCPGKFFVKDILFSMTVKKN